MCIVQNIKAVVRFGYHNQAIDGQRTQINKILFLFFPIPCHSAPSLPMFLLEFHGEVNHEETRVMGLLCGESCAILTLTVFD